MVGLPWLGSWCENPPKSAREADFQNRPKSAKLELRRVEEKLASAASRSNLSAPFARLDDRELSEGHETIRRRPREYRQSVGKRVNPVTPLLVIQPAIELE
jgi:hypothetical protein